MARAKTAYHHGDLKEAMLAEAERMLDADGVHALTLREAARRVGVSHTAPQKHFGDLTGLLSDLAARGHEALKAKIDDAVAAAGVDRRKRLRAMGRAYVAFAAERPGLFALMSQSARLDKTRPALRDAIAGSRGALLAAVAQNAANARPSKTAVAEAVAAWSLVHGYATLLQEGRLNAMLTAAELDPMQLFERALDSVQFNRPA
jgi:AcrR family transcriptional regulator